MPGVSFELNRPRFFRRCFERRQESIQWCLYIDNQVARVRHMNDEVGAERALVGCNSKLLGEVAGLRHAGELDEPTQRELTPAPPHLGPAKGGHQIASL